MNTQKFDIIAKTMNLNTFYKFNFDNNNIFNNTITAQIQFNSKKQQRTFFKKVTDNYNHYNCEETKNRAIATAGTELAIDIELQ